MLNGRSTNTTVSESLIHQNKGRAEEDILSGRNLLLLMCVMSLPLEREVGHFCDLTFEYCHGELLMLCQTKMSTQSPE